MIRAIPADNCEILDTVQLLAWCRDYQKNGPFPRPPLERFCIGVYQIPQGFGWKVQGGVAWQSYCAAALHTMMAAEALELGLEQFLPPRISGIAESFSGWQQMLAHIGRAQQQLVYSNGGPHWRKRYKKDTLKSAFANVVTECFALVPVAYRATGISDEMGIITNDVILPR